MLATMTTTFPRRVALARPVGLGHATFGAAMALVWLHLLDAAIVHPQVAAGPMEHLLQAVLAMSAAPLAVLAYPRLRRGWRGLLALAAGLPAFAAGATIHIVGVIKNEAWQRSDHTGVLMAAAGLTLVILGLILLTAAIPRARWRMAMIPAVPLLLLYVAAPLGIATYVTHAPRYVIEPQDLGAPYEDVAFTTSDGLTLRGWYVPSRNGAAVAVMHGSGGARIRPLEHGRMLVRNGYGVLLFDSRGHGASDGPTNALGWTAAPDASAAAGYLRTRADVQPGRIGLLGLSMGAEIAITAAAGKDDFAAIVADGPSGRTVADALDSSLGRSAKLIWLGPMYSAELMEKALSRSLPPADLVRLSPKVTEPVLYIASGVDKAESTLVSRVAERSGGEHELWVIEGVGHTQGLAKRSAEYEGRVMGFFEAHLAPRAAATPPAPPAGAATVR